MVWLTCCALHYYILYIDGLSKDWNNGVLCEYERSNDIADLPFTIRRLVSTTGVIVSDHSGMGCGTEFISDSDNSSDNDEFRNAIPNSDGSINVTYLTLVYFRKKVSHISILVF